MLLEHETREEREGEGGNSERARRADVTLEKKADGVERMLPRDTR